MTRSVSSLKFRCPVSRSEVETSVRTDAATLAQMNRLALSLWCPHCRSGHIVQAGDAYLDAVQAWQAA